MIFYQLFTFLACLSFSFPPVACPGCSQSVQLLLHCLLHPVATSNTGYLPLLRSHSGARVEARAPDSSWNPGLMMNNWRIWVPGLARIIYLDTGVCREQIPSRWIQFLAIRHCQASVAWRLCSEVMAWGLYTGSWRMRAWLFKSQVPGIRILVWAFVTTFEDNRPHHHQGPCFLPPPAHCTLNVTSSNHTTKGSKKRPLERNCYGPGILPPEEAAQKNASQLTIEEA